MAIGRLKIFGLDFTFVFRHRYEKPDEDRLVDKFTMWKDWRVGFFFKRMKIVGEQNSNKPHLWHKNLVRAYMFGIDLLICKLWFTVSKGAMELKRNEKL